MEPKRKWPTGSIEEYLSRTAPHSKARLESGMRLFARFLREAEVKNGALSEENQRLRAEVDRLRCGIAIHAEDLQRAGFCYPEHVSADLSALLRDTAGTQDTGPKGKS